MQQGYKFLSANGFVALMSMMVISGTLLLLLTAVSTIMWRVQQASLLSVAQLEARALAETCYYEAIYKIISNTSFRGGVDLLISSSSCEIKNFTLDETSGRALVTIVTTVRHVVYSEEREIILSNINFGETSEEVNAVPQARVGLPRLITPEI